MAREFLVALDLNKNELQNPKIHNLPGAPSATASDKGLMYMNTADNILYWWNGSIWKSAEGGAVAFGAVLAETSFGIARNDGVAVTAARSDHTHGSPVHDAAAHSAIPLNALATATANINMGGFKVTSVGNPTSIGDAVNKLYVDSIANGLNWKAAVRCATTANVTLSGLPTIDGVTLLDGNRILVKNQTNQTENGIYNAWTAGWIRSEDMDQGPEFVSATVMVSSGTTQADTSWTCTNDGVTVGTTGITFVQVSGPGAIVAGSGLTQSGTTINAGAGTGISVAADTIGLDLTYTDGRYVLVGNAPKRYQVDVGGATSQVLTHNLGTVDVIVQLYRKLSPFDQIECDVEHTSVTTVTVRFAVAPAAAEYRAVVLA